MRFASLIIFLVIFTLSITLPRSVFAVAYDLIPPSGPLQRGQDIEFIIDLDTQGSTVTSGTVGLEYDTQYLSYKSAVQGEAMTSLTVTQQDGRTLAFTGSNPSGFSGLGTFATVTFTLIATAPGSTQLCTLIESGTTPTPIPTTKPPNPTQLPKSGVTVAGDRTATAGIIFLLGSIGLYIWINHKKHA